MSPRRTYPSAPTTDDFRCAIARGHAAFQKAATLKDVSAIANLYADDATLMPPGSSQIKGREGIREYWQSFLDAGTCGVMVHILNVQSSGAMAYEFGEFQMTLCSKRYGTHIRKVFGSLDAAA